MSAADVVPIAIAAAAALTAAAGGMLAGAHLWERQAREESEFAESLKRIPLATEREQAPEPWDDTAVFRYTKDGAVVEQHADGSAWVDGHMIHPPRPRSAPADYLAESDREWLRRHGWSEPSP